MALTDTAIRAMRPAAKPYKRADGGGLNLMVNPNGSKLWRLAYRFDGKQKLLAGGTYPAVGLADARTWRDNAKRQLANGVDPSEHRKKEKRKAAIAAANDFETVAREWHSRRKAKWTKGYAKVVLTRLERDIFPSIGQLSISRVEASDLLSAIRAIEKRGSIYTGRRVNALIGHIFRYAIALGIAERDPSRDITAALRERPPIKHRARLASGDLAKFFGKLEIEPLERLTRTALLLTIYTLVRTNETRFAEWSEFERLDGKEPLWRIPASRMKMRTEHLVPLAPRVASLLQELRALELSGPFLFPGVREGVISENTMLYALYRLGYHSKATVHGFRGTGSTILNETGQFEPDWIERQLAHDERNQVRAAYNAAQYLPQRRKMLEWWANYLDDQQAVGRLL